MGFAQIMLASLGPTIVVPPPILAYFEWIEALGLARTFRDGRHYALIDPALESSCMGVLPPFEGQIAAWTGIDDPEVTERLVPFCRTGGDGSHAALWMDDTGEIRIVHMGSGSGSAMVGVMAEDPVDFLRLLAIGYNELCWKDQFDQTPYEVHEAEFPSDDYMGIEDDRPEPPAQPAALQAWLIATFGVTIPARAADILRDLPDMGDQDTDDPFVRWLSDRQRACGR